MRVGAKINRSRRISGPRAVPQLTKVFLRRFGEYGCPSGKASANKERSIEPPVPKTSEYLSFRLGYGVGFPESKSFLLIVGRGTFRQKFFCEPQNPRDD